MIAVPLEYGVDYRVPGKRKEAFLAYYEAMLKTGELHQQLRLVNWAINMDSLSQRERVEKKLWASFLWGATYNLPGVWTILDRFPQPPESILEFKTWYDSIFDKMRFDTDCRYRKSKMVACVKSYCQATRARGQYGTLKALMTGDRFENFRALWAWADNLQYFGRLSNWNYVEAVAITMKNRWTIDSPDLMLEDISGSESNRNGVAWVIGNEQLATHHGRTAADRCLTSNQLQYLVGSGNQLWYEAQDRLAFTTDDMTMLNFETALCWSKKMMSRVKHSRYLGWDGDRTWDELKYLEEAWPEVDVEPVWSARIALVPITLRCETYPKHWKRGVDKSRMKSFFETGTLPEVIAFQQGEYCAPAT